MKDALGEGIQKHDITSARPSFLWGEKRAGPGWARWDSQELMYCGEEERMGRKADIKGGSSGALEWFLERMTLQFSVQMFPPSAPYSEFTP